MRKVIIGVVLALILAIGGTFFYVISIDWNKHKNKISEQFYNSTGKHIVFVGNVSFRILPYPYLRAINAKIYNSENKNEVPLLDIKNIDAELSLASLLNGEVNIKKMILDGVTININCDDKGLNWQGDLSADQRQMMKDTKLVLNSLSLKNATVNFEAADGDIAFTVNNINGEVMAQSVFGPFRLEGNYMRGNVPEGFAITIGKMEENLPTTLNMALTHPKSSSYIRFDGTFQLSNKVINGNVVVESQKLSDFVNDHFENAKISEKYNKPIVTGFDLAVNKQMINLSNIVIKYGETQGAGSIQMPNDNLNSPKIKANFEFAELTLDPFVDEIKAFVSKYTEETYSNTSKINVDADIRSVRATYNGQTFKDFVLMFEYGEKGLLLDNLNVMLPGNAQLVIKGNVYDYDGDIYYQSDISLSTNELMRLLKWINIEPKATATAVYKKMLLTTKISGNFDKMQISPYKIVLDNTTFNGDAGIVFGERKDIIINVSANSLNFDNYIKSLPDEIKAKSFIDRLNYRFSKLGVLNDFDMVLNADANLVIYEGVPFETLSFKGSLLQSNLEIEELNVEEVANTSLNIKGNVSGFGEKAKFENLQYIINAQDVVNMIEKFELSKPEFDYNRFYNFSATGTLNGDLDNFNIDTEFNSGVLTGRYEGSVNMADNILFNGSIELKHPELITFIESVGGNYKVQSPNLGLFRFKSKINGTMRDMDLQDMELNIGYSQFGGNVSYDFRGNNKIASADLKINKFEADKYMIREDGKLALTAKLDGGAASFLTKPVWNKDRINYTPYSDWEFKGKFDIADLSYKNYMFQNAKFDLDVNKGLLNLSNFEAFYKNAPIKVKATLNMIKDPSIVLDVDVAEANISDFSIGGRTYNMKDGKFSSKIILNSKASSEESFVNNLNGSIDFKASDTKLSGVNIKGIYKDIVKREKSEGLVEFANTQIVSGSTAFENVAGKINITEGEFKITEGSLSAENINVTAKGGGNIKNWTMDVSFEIKHDEPRYLQGYTLQMKNSMDNPDVTVDVSKLFNIFKSREDQKVAEEKAKIETEKMQLTQLIEEQKKIAEDLVKSTEGKMSVEIDEKITGAFSNDSVKSYQDIKTELETLLNSFLDSTLLIDSKDPTQEKIDTLKKVNQNALQDIEVLQEKIDQVRLADLQKQNAVEYEKIIKINNELKDVVAQYNAKKSTYVSRLSNVITEYNLEKDEGYIALTKGIDTAINELEGLNNDIVASKNMYQVSGSISDYEQFNAKIGEVLNKLSSGMENLVNRVKEFENTTEQVIAKEEDLYHKKLEEEENQRLIEENTGSISVKKTGKTRTIRRNIKEIKETNEEISNETVKVIDFSKKKSISEKASVKDNQGVVKKGRSKR
ncbi:MAG: AsmA family protein [Alphaproteobacteria bacterium]|nr:AsmA family protein [Alphaproteobacteria bacterium]